MTAEEIKATYSMNDIVRRYGLIPNRRGFISCPFHERDRTPSLKVYEKDFHCHSCGANGDIFTFVQMMEGVSFKEAFQILGGTYEKPTFSSRLAVYRSRKRREMLEKERENQRKRRQLNNLLISVYQKHLQRAEPLSDSWCSCYNALQYQIYLHEHLNNPEERYGIIKQTE